MRRVPALSHTLSFSHIDHYLSTFGRCFYFISQSAGRRHGIASWVWQNGIVLSTSTGRLSVFAMAGFGTHRYVCTQLADVGLLGKSRMLINEQKGMIVKWAILGSLFAIFMLWFVGGYIHAKRRLRAGKPLLAYHRVRPVSPLLPPPPPSSPQNSVLIWCSSSSSPTKNANATAKPRKTTSPSTQRRTPTRPRTNPRTARLTHNAQTARGPNPRRCIMVVMRRRATSPRLARPKRARSTWRCRRMEHQWHRDRSRAVL